MGPLQVAGSLNMTLAIVDPVVEEGEELEVPLLHATTSRLIRNEPAIKKIGQGVPVNVFGVCFAVTIFLPRKTSHNAIEEKQEIAKENGEKFSDGAHMPPLGFGSFVISRRLPEPTLYVKLILVAVVVGPVLIVPVGVAVAVTVVMIFMVPVSFVIPPAVRIPVIVRMGPVRSRERRAIVVPGNPTIPGSLRGPEARYPHKVGLGGRGWRWFVAYWWWRDSDND